MPEIPDGPEYDALRAMVAARIEEARQSLLQICADFEEHIAACREECEERFVELLEDARKKACQ